MHEQAHLGRPPVHSQLLEHGGRVHAGSRAPRGVRGMEGKKGGRADRIQRNARHATKAPTTGHYGNSLAREGESPLLLVFLFALLILFACLFGLDDEADLRAHDKWAADMKEQGAWVMW